MSNLLILASADIDPRAGAVLLGILAIALAVIGIIVSLRCGR